LNLEGFIIIIVFGAVLSLILSNALLAIASEVSAQLVQNTNTSSSLPPSIKISSPVKGQQVPIGTPLTIIGTSTDDPVDNCQVSVILNGIKPYQKTTATGQSGSEVGSANDYSTWKYAFNPGYAVIKQGTNKITSKISCSPQGNSAISLSKWYSVNVTGVANARMEQLVQPSKTIITAAMAPPTTANQKVTGTTNTATTTSSIPSIPLNALYNNNNNNTPKLLALSVDVSKDPIKRGSKETVITEVSDAASKEKIAGAKVVGKVTGMSGGSVKESFEGTSDKDGKESYSWKIAENGKATKYKVTVQASAAGYQDVTSSTAFKVKPASTTTTSKNDQNSNDAGGSSSSHENRNRHNNDNSFEKTTIHSSWNDNRNNNNIDNTNDNNNDNTNDNNNDNSDNSFEIITDSSSHEEDQNISNNNDFGESMADNINDFTHEIINGVNDMVKIHLR
jgi:hypothetical protein